MKILLIGGSSGVGKTALARKVSINSSIPLLLVDDLRIGIQAATGSATHPDLHVFLNYSKEQWQNAELICTDWIRVGKAMMKPISAVISHHITTPDAGRIIIEGDGIIPIAYGRTEEKGAVRSVFVIEQSEKRLLQNIRVRGRVFTGVGEAEQEALARASWLYGQWISQQAKKLALPVLNAHPQETLLERLLAAIAGA